MSLKGKETGNGDILRGIPQWIHNAAHDCMKYAQEVGGHIRGGIPRQAKFADIIAAHQPKPDDTWMFDAAKEFYDEHDVRIGSDPSINGIKSIMDIIHKHAPKP